MKYTKPALSIPQQIELLESRGLVVKDKSRAESYLSNISYYRFSAYLLPFQDRTFADHRYNNGVSFDEVLNLYLFDRELRLLVFDIIERLEIAFRTQIIYQYSNAFGAWWYEDPKHFINNYHYSRNLARIDEEIERSSEVFIEHYKNRYTSPQRPPAWMTYEVISMGLLSKVFRNLQITDAKKRIAHHFQLPTPYNFRKLDAQYHVCKESLCAPQSSMEQNLNSKTPTFKKTKEYLALIKRC